MDYEKEYKSLVAKVKNAHLFAQTDSTKNVLEDILPELRESEDERIRKKCIELIKRVIPSGDSQSQESKEILDCITYLEKQKEPLFDFAVIKRAWYMEGYKDREFGKESKWIIKTGEGGPKYEENPKYGQPLAKMQKPAEIDFEDWDTLGYIRDIVRKHVRRDEEFNVLDKWLTEHYVNQKSAWGEEDEKMVRFYEDDYDNNLGNMPMCDVIENRIKFKDWLLNRLKSIRPQPKQEWSEEDEKKIHFLSRLIEFQVKDGEYCFGEGSCAISKQEAIEMLQSLRPSWKPSEEQMKALKFFLDFHRPQRNAGTTNWREYDAVESLYEQLKKL